MKHDADIAIVGGGLGGSLAALTLAQAGFTISLIDAAPPGRNTLPAFDGRTTALAYASARLFQRLGLWTELEPHAGPISDILVTDGRPKDRFRTGRQASGHLHFDARRLEEATPLGWIVENRRLRLAMAKAIKAQKSIDVIAPATCGPVETGTAGVTLPLDTGQRLSASLLIAADGKASPLREAAGIETLSWDYPQTGIVCTIAHERPHGGIAQEFFLPSGPFAILPMTENRSSIVWTEKADRAQSYLAMTDVDFVAALGARIGDYLGNLSLDGPRWSYPLSFHLATKFHADRLAVIGDAAHAIHPIAGQGYNLGVKDIAALRDVLVETRGAGLDIGNGTALARYHRWRYFDSAALAFGTDTLNRLFGIDNPLVRAVRSTGLGLVNRIDPMRDFFMKQAGADVGELPSLMQPLGTGPDAARPVSA